MPIPCPKCGGEMRPGQALQQTYGGIPDFPGCEVMTMSPGGPGRLVPCLKCSKCGHSTTVPATTSKAGVAGDECTPNLATRRN